MYDPDAMPDPLPAEAPGAWVPGYVRERTSQRRSANQVPGEGRATEQARRVARERAANYGGKVSLIDAWIGRILDVLERQGLAENTLVVFLSDHGEMGGDHGRYQKSVFYESALRIPMIVRWTSALPAGRTSAALVEHIDLFPTFLEAAGVEPSRRALGHSLLPLARGDVPAVRAAAHSELGGEIMVRTHRHKYAVDRQGRGYLLYDLVADPGEQTNLIGHHDHAALERTLREDLLTWLVSTQLQRN
jgi:uncharacterized sulfatase